MQTVNYVKIAVETIIVFYDFQYPKMENRLIINSQIFNVELVFSHFLVFLLFRRNV